MNPWEVKFFLAVVLGLVGHPASASLVRYSYDGYAAQDATANWNFPSPFEPGDLTTNVMVEFEIQELAPNTPLQTIVPQNWTVSDGFTVVTESTVGYTANTFLVATDSLGNISDWNIVVSLVTPTLTPGTFTGARTFYRENFEFGTSIVSYGIDVYGYCQTIDDVGLGGLGCISSGASVEFGPDSFGPPQPPEWQISLIPIPAAAWLFGSSLVALGMVRRASADGPLWVDSEHLL